MSDKISQDLSPISEEYVPSSSKLYFIFGGIVQGLGIPIFEFFNSSRILSENKIFFRDFSQSWYQNGLAGIGDDVFAIANFIDKKLEDINPMQVYFVGNSMGGYAAILFAALAKKGTAIAFAPQTFISPAKRLRYLDGRWRTQILRTYLTTTFKKHIYDVKDKVALSEEIKIEIFVSKNNHLDYIHANELRNLKAVTIHEFDQNTHGIVKQLRDSGKLADILKGN